MEQFILKALGRADLAVRDDDEEEEEESWGSQSEESLSKLGWHRKLL